MQEYCSQFLKVVDELMSAIRFQTMAKVNLPHLSYIFRKLKPLGTKFNKVACSITAALLFIEVQRGEEGMKEICYQKDLGATAVCTKRMMEATKEIGQKSKKGGTKDCSSLVVVLNPIRRQKPQ